MGKKQLIFNGIKSYDDLGVVIQTTPDYKYPEKDVTATHIQGRDGDILVDNGSYRNTTRSYTLGVGYSLGSAKPSFIENAEQLTKWLEGTPGYHRLEDDYDPDVYRLAEYKAGGSFTDIYDGATSFSVDFDCKPQRFLKSGEREVTFNSSSASITNPTGYSSLPVIKITGLSSDSATATIFSVVDSDGNKVSDITIKDIPGDELTIDSEQQSVYAGSKDMSAYTNMNGKDFPKLKKGTSKLTVSKYNRETISIKKYTDVLKDNYSECDIVYSPYDKVLEQRQKSTVIPSLNTIKIKNQDVFYAEGYSLLAQEKGESFTFKSFNTILSEQSFSGTFLTSDAEGNGDMILSSGFAKLKKNADGKTFDYVVPDTLSGNGGGYYYGPKDKKWMFHKVGEAIVSQCTLDSQVTIKYCPAKKKSDGKFDMDLKYGNAPTYECPDWITFKIDYDSNGSPNKVSFMTAKSGWYYTEKTGILSKLSMNRSGWANYNAGEVLDTISWSLINKDFRNFGGSATQTFTYKHIDELPQYDDVYEYKTDSNGNKKKVLNTACPVTVAGSLDTPSYKAKKAGWFRANDSGITNDDDEKYVSWVYLNAGDPITVGVKTKITESNTFYFIEGTSVVNYKKTSGWPDWLDPNPVSKTSGADIVNATAITFKVKKAAKYRYKYKDTSTGDDVWSDWTDLSEGAEIPHEFAPNESATIAMIEELPTDYSDDGITDDSLKSYNLSFNKKRKKEGLPSWLGFEWIPGNDTDSDVNNDDPKYKLLANQDGYYKFDSNLNWKYYKKGEELNTNAYTDDTSVYFLKELPEYPSNEIYTSSVTKSETGNPTQVTFTISKSGYYKLDSSIYLKYYEAGKTLITSDVNTSHVLEHYYGTDDAISGITITVKPNWWML